MNIVSRFAPSPTGYLHVGNARVALVNWLMARKFGGQFILRLDDTDTDRSSELYVEGIKEDLLWLGLNWDRTFRQTERLGRYKDAFHKLQSDGRLYPCYETQDELSLKRKTQLSQGLPPRYDRSSLELTQSQRASFEQAGRRPYWRFLLKEAEINWYDAVRGSVHFSASHLTDPVLFREDGKPLYTFSSCVDDIDEGVTHIIRGEDHVSNTAVQFQLIKALGGIPEDITFAHLSLLTGVSGEGLSKRDGSLSLKEIRAGGIEPMAINSLLARLGTTDPIEPSAKLLQLIDSFDISKFGRATPKFDPEDLVRINRNIISTATFDEIRSRLPNGTQEAEWLAVSGNLNKISEFEFWRKIWLENLTPVIEDIDYLIAASEELPSEPWDGDTWKRWTTSVQLKTGRKGKALFRPLRLALTALDRGPEMAAMLPLIGRQRALKRLTGVEAAKLGD